MTSIQARCSLFALAVGLAAPAFGQAQEPPAPAAAQESRTTAYPKSFFAGSAPQTALEIARLVPGFSLDLGDVEVRGFGQAAGNVVINGSRPSTKSESLEQVLRNIPARSVVRVEVGPGDIYGAEYSGKSQVLNVILSEESGVNGTVTAIGRRLYDGTFVGDIAASALIRRGEHSINLSAGTGNVLNHEEGTDTLTDPDTGERIEYRRKYNTYHDFNPYVSANWALEKASNRSFHVNARWSPGQFDLTQENHVTPAIGPERDDDLLQDFDNPVFELGGDATLPLASGAVKVIGLATRRKRDWLEQYRNRSAGGEEVLGGFEQTQQAKLNETILKFSWTKADLFGLSFEAGIEGALNTLDHQVAFSRILPGGVLLPIDLPLDNAKVEEKRGEAYVSLGKQFTPSLRVDAGLNYEFSTLTVSGDTEAERSLAFPKPSMTVDWKGPDGWHAQASIARTVAQLNFYDFISSAELSADRVNAGNADLVPQRAWEFRGTVDHPLLGDGLAKLDLGYDHISLLQDQILTAEGFNAPGNIGTGKRAFAALTLDAPLGSLGIKGARIKFFGQVQRTRVEDPISGEMRNFSGFFPDWQWDVDFRHDIGSFSYGFSVNDRDRFTFFRTDEFDTNWNEGPYGTAYVEYRPDSRTTITLDLDNAFSTHGLRNRLIYKPNRGAPTSVVDEMRERNRHRNFGLTIKRTFGGGGAAPVQPG